MENNLKGLPSVRLVDIEKEILKGKTIKPGILNDDEPELPPKELQLQQGPGPSNKRKLALTQQKPAKRVATNPPAQPVPVVMNSVVLLTTTVPTMMVNTLPAPKATAPVSPVKCVVATKAPPTQPNLPTILRKPTQVVTQQVPVEKMWSEMKNGVRFLHPSNLDQDVLNKVANTLKTKKSLKNTIISLPNKVFLVPLNCIQGGPLPSDSLVSIKSVPEKPVQPETPLKHHCWSTKKHRKLDLEGFGAYDKLGFYKAEAMKAKKCLKNLEIEIEKLTQSINSLTEELKVYEVPKKIVFHMNPTKTSKNKRKRCRRVIGPRPAPVVTPFFKILKPNQLNQFHSGSTVVLDHTDFETFEACDSVLYVNRDDVITSMILEKFPKFQEAVDSGMVKIVNEADYISVFGSEVKKFTNESNNSDKEERFKQFVKNSPILTDVMNDHSYAIDEEFDCCENRLLRISKTVPYHQ